MPTPSRPHEPGIDWLKRARRRARAMGHSLGHTLWGRLQQKRYRCYAGHIARLDSSRLVKCTMRHKALQEWRTAQSLIGNAGGGIRRNPLRHTARGVRPCPWEKPLEAQFETVTGRWSHRDRDSWRACHGAEPTAWWDLTQERVAPHDRGVSLSDTTSVKLAEFPKRF